MIQSSREDRLILYQIAEYRELKEKLFQELNKPEKNHELIKNLNVSNI
jgi:hypothetical protein